MLMKVAIVLLLVGIVASQAAAPFQRVSLTDLNPEAVCNDGSPATYFFRPGTGSGSNIWTIYQEGGGWCFDEGSCQQRWNQTKHFMTSTQLPAVLNDTTKSPDVNHGGINSGNATVNPHFYNANQVYLWYCSSDTHSGNGSFGGWQFKGRVIIQTLIQHLVKVQQPSMTNAKYVLLTGFSAGGMGVFNNADFVGQMVTSLVPGVTFKAYVDSGWFIDMPNYYSGGYNGRQTFAIAMKNFNLLVDEDCTETYARANVTYRCIFANDVFPFISTDLFVAGYQFDAPFMGGDGPPFNNVSWEYAKVFTQTFLAQTSPLPNLFSPNCYCHGNEAYDTRWNAITIQGHTASESVYTWLTSPTPTNIRWVDDNVFNGNPTCYCVY